MWKALFAVGFESAYRALRKSRPCRLRRDPDTFDGEIFTVDEFYNECVRFFDRPWEFFKDFAYPGAPNLRTVRRTVGHVYEEEMLFDSPVRSGWPENDLVPFKVFRRSSSPARTILLFAPGWGRRNQRVEEKMCRRLAKLGIDVGLMTKPYHQSRAPRGSVSGEYFISANIFWTVENFRQFTAEIRLLIQHMRKIYRHVGLIGMSSGGFQTGLAANCEDVSFFFPIITGCRLGQITWSSVLTKHIRSELEQRGVSQEDLTKAWSITDQYVLGKHCKARHIKQYISLYDRVIDPKFQWSLWDVYGRPHCAALECSHYSVYFELDRIVDDIAAFVTERGG